MSKQIRVISTKYNGSPRDEWPAQIMSQQGTQIVIYVAAGTEEIIKGIRRGIIEHAYTGWYWTDRWYNIWHFERSAGVVFFANVSMPCRLDDQILRWIDLDLDIVQFADGSIVVEDQEEFEQHCQLFAYPPEVIDNALAARDELLHLARVGAFPFVQ